MDQEPFDMFGVGQPAPESKTIIQPQLVERLKAGARGEKSEIHELIIERLQELANSIIAVFTHEGGVIGWGLEVIDDFIQGIPILGDIYALLRKLITGEGDIEIPAILESSRAALAKVPIIGDLMEIISGVEDGNLNDVGTWVNNILGVLGGLGRNTNRILLELQAKLSEGATFSDTFDGPNTSSLGNGWVQGGEGTALEVRDNAARLNGLSGISAGTRYAICPVVAGDNNVTVAVGVNNKGVATAAMTSIILRANADMTEFVYANVYRNRVYIGRGTRAGNAWTYSDWKSNTSVNIAEGSVVEFQAEDAKYRLTCNGETLIDWHTDITGYPVDATHRTVGFTQETRFVLVAPIFSWGLVVFTMRSTVKLTAIEGLDTKLGVVSDTVDDVSGTVGAVADTLNQLVGEKNAEGSNGVSHFYNFASYGPGNTLTGLFNHQVAGRIGVKSNGFAGPIVTGDAEGRIVTKSWLTADDQQISIVIGAGTTFDAFTEAFLRSNAACTTGVSMSFGKDTMRVGRWVAPSPSGAISSWTQYGTDIPINYSAGDTFTLQAVGETYTVLKNGNPIAIRVGSGSPIGPLYRYGGLLFFQTAGIFTVSPPLIRSLTIADFATPTYRGTGFRIIRSLTTATANTSGDQSYLPANTFDVISEQSNMGAINLANGTVEILKAGYWTFFGKVQFNAAAGGTNRYTASILRERSGDLRRPMRGADFQGSLVFGAVVSHSFYCESGDIVNLGCDTASGRGVVGAVDGSNTAFSGFLGSS